MYMSSLEAFKSNSLSFVDYVISIFSVNQVTKNVPVQVT